METTRRTFLGVAGAAATAAAASRAAKTSGTQSGPKFYVAAVTPCDIKGKFDEALYRDLMPFLKERGADGVVVLGTTGEFPSFSVAERKRVAETALKHRSGLEMIVQVGTPNLPETLELLAHATANGADQALCIPPFYFKDPSLEGLTRYYSQVLEASKIPVNLYHIPGTSAVPISHELLHALEKYPNLAGIKDSTGKADGYEAFVKAFPKLNMMTGTDNNIPTALKNGMGAILMGGNLYTKQSAAVFAAHRQGKDITEAMTKLREANQLLRGVPGAGGVPVIKYALGGLGLRESYVRPPYVNLTDEQKALLKPKVAQLAQLA
jgi:4-hydroxy-tetrahydrodipicolinate synthase